MPQSEVTAAGTSDTVQLLLLSTIEQAQEAGHPLVGWRPLHARLYLATRMRPQTYTQTLGQLPPFVVHSYGCVSLALQELADRAVRRGLLLLDDEGRRSWEALILRVSGPGRRMLAAQRAEPMSRLSQAERRIQRVGRACDAVLWPAIEPLLPLAVRLCEEGLSTSHALSIGLGEHGWTISPDGARRMLSNLHTLDLP